MASNRKGGFSETPIYHAIHRQIETLSLKGSVLDFGAGIGNLLKALESKTQFHSITGADILPRPEGLAASTTWISSDLNHPLSLPDATFDVIIAAEIIEHLENPRAVAREWFRLLRPGGSLVMSTPNNESWRSILALIFRGAFVAFLSASYPNHKTALLRIDLERILQEAGFTVNGFDYTHSGCIPKMPQWTWQQISAGRMRGRRFSDNIIACALKPPV